MILSIIIPVYNEEKTINQVLKSVKKYGTRIALIEKIEICSKRIITVRINFKKSLH